MKILYNGFYSKTKAVKKIHEIAVLSVCVVIYIYICVCVCEWVCARARA